MSAKRNNFQFVSNDSITREVLYFFYSRIYFIFSKSICLTEDDSTTVGKDNYILTLLLQLNKIIALITTITS